MTSRRTTARLRTPGLLVVMLSTIALVSSLAVAPSLPTRLSDEEFWRLSTSLSEVGGTFPSNNFVSNEFEFQSVVPALRERIHPGGVYVGVGPDQNFTYILAVEPAIAFIVDIRRQNLLHHLLYKALIELSADRHGFVSRLFGRPSDVPPLADDLPGLMQAVAAREADPAFFDATNRAVLERLEKGHGFTLSPDDRFVLERVHRAFFDFGPGITYAPVPPSVAGSARAMRLLTPFPTYADLVQSDDGAGTNWSYLATEDAYAALREMHLRNLIVPVVGDFAGRKAIREIGEWARQHDGTVTALYTSNVEQYLFQNEVWPAYYDNIATLPLDASSTFIRAFFPTRGWFAASARIIVAPGEARRIEPPVPVTRSPFIASSTLLDPVQQLLADVEAGRVHTYLDVINRAR